MKKYLKNGAAVGIIIGIIKVCQQEAQEEILAGIPNAIAVEEAKKMCLEAMECATSMIQNAPFGKIPEIKKIYPY